jgi:proteic killer suppression protein
MAKLDAKLGSRIRVRLSRLHAATAPTDMNVAGFDFHPLTGKRSGTYTVHVNGPWCITFQREGDDAISVDLEQYH